MTYRIHHENDSIDLSADTIEEIQAKARTEMEKRGWGERDCWSEELANG